MARSGIFGGEGALGSGALGSGSALAFTCMAALGLAVACGSDTDTSSAKDGTTGGSSGSTSGGSAGGGNAGVGGQNLGSASSGGSGNGGTSGAAQCGNLMGADIGFDEYPLDCSGLEESTAYRCAEQRFWYTLRADYDQRPQAYETLSALIEKYEASGDQHEVSNLYFRRGQLAMAMAMENGDMNKVLTVEPDFDKTLELWPEHPIAPTWRDTMRIAIAVVTKDYVAAQKLFDEALKNVELCPLGNIPSLTGTTIGLPLDTGIPQQTVKLAESWVCEGVEWCEHNTWKAPYAVAGMRYHMGEGFARVGRKEEALAYFESARQAPDYDSWPYKDFVDNRTENIDAFIKELADVGESEPVFDRMYANSEFGCKFCHGTK
ncbi:MAG: hypothetical protein AB7S68_30160 [Polyangiaceae bacterium]